MEHLSDLLLRLPDRHRMALEWFIAHAGTTQAWPAPLPDGTLLVSRAQGIYKPSWTQHGLSVRQSLGGPYSDEEPVVRADGTWSYLYAKEASDPNSRDSDYANRSLAACMVDRVPIGVIRQVRSKPKSQYHVLGVALVAGHDEGYFFLEGFSPEGQASGPGPLPQIEALSAAQERVDTTAGTFEPASVLDGRERIIASVVRRRGQPEFRRRLLEIYGGQCAVTGCNALEALEAAHIVPYWGPETNQPSNGILLRADIHTLFDVGLLAVDTATMTVLLASNLASTSYHQLAGTRLQLPKDRGCEPSKKALDHHRAWSGL